MLFFCILSLLFATSLFKNISYPLFWADESMTAMGGVRVLEFGYPKVHDGKNVLYDLKHSNPSLGIDEKTDAYIGGANWGQYYIAAVGVKLAELTDDIFARTAIIRSIFALIGLAGLAILAHLGRQFFQTNLSKTGFLTLFVFFEVISVPLVLHLREARYYSLLVFLTALTAFIYTRYRILKITRYLTYVLLMAFLLIIVFINFSPVYFILFASISMFESIPLIKDLISKYRGERSKTGTADFTLKEIFKDYLLALLPVIISLIAVLPLIFFFKIFYIAKEMSNYNMFGLGKYVENLSVIWRYFASSDFIYLAIFSKICLVFCLIKSSDKDISPTAKFRVRFSNLLTVIFMIYFFAIARIPNFPFTRYFIPLQPILALIMLLDLATVYNFISQPLQPILAPIILLDFTSVYNFISQLRLAVRPYYKDVLVVICVVFLFFNVSKNYEYLKGHVYEVYNQYRGPLDYLIPFIKENYKNTDVLVIATNYEETSFMYYLNAKVTVGFVGNNLEQDSKIVPDIIVYRKWHRIFLPVFRNFLEEQPYGRISFPVADYPVNNLPELNWAPPFEHQFRTEESEDEEEKVDIFVRK